MVSEELYPQALGILPGLTEPDVLQSVQMLPGVKSPNETASGLHIRGGTPDQNLILFDGIKMYNSAHFFGMVSAFNPYITKNTKVFRGGASAVYGNHVSGVIDMKSDDTLPTKFSGGFGSNLTHADVFFKLPINKKIGLSVSGRRSFTDLFSTVTFRELSKKVFQNTIITRDDEIQTNIAQERFNTFFYTDITARLLISASPKDDLAISYLHNRNQLDYFLDLGVADETSEHFLNFVNNGISSIWKRRWNENLEQKTKVYYSDFDFTYNFDRQNLNNPINEVVNKTNRIKELHLQSTFNWKLKERLSINLGYEVSNSNVGFSLTNNFPGQQSSNFSERSINNTHTLFGEYIYENDGKTVLQLGLRSNYFSLTEHLFFSPRIYAQLNLFPQFWLKTAGEIKQQNVSQIVEFFTQDFGLENQVWGLTNDTNIPLLKSNQLSLGFILEKNKWSIDVDAYRKEIDGLTSHARGFVSQGNGNISEGKSISLGLDVFIKKKWKNYSTWVSYSLSNTTFKFGNINNGRSFAGNYDTKHQFLWTNSLKAGNFNFSLGWRLRTGIPYTPAIGINTNDNSTIDYEAINSKRLPLYHRLDFSSTYDFNLGSSERWKCRIGFSLLNMYNKKNILQRIYRIQVNEDDSSSLVKTDVFSLGITPNIVLRTRF